MLYEIQKRFRISTLLGRGIVSPGDQDELSFGEGASNMLRNDSILSFLSKMTREFRDNSDNVSQKSQGDKEETNEKGSDRELNKKKS